MEWLSKAFDALKLSPKYLVPISVATGFLLFATTNVLNKLGLNELKTKYTPWIGGIFLVSTTLLLSHAVIAALSWMKNKIKRSLAIRNSRKRLHSLILGEKEILRGFILGQTKTQYLDLENGVVRGLELDIIIYKASNIGQINTWAYNIQSWAWDYLNEHPALLLFEQELKSWNRRKKKEQMQWQKHLKQ